MNTPVTTAQNEVKRYWYRDNMTEMEEIAGDHDEDDVVLDDDTSYLSESSPAADPALPNEAEETITNPLSKPTRPSKEASK